MSDEVPLSVKEEFVRNQVCFSKLNAPEIEELAALFKEVHFDAGETIVVETEPVETVFLIVKGKVDVRHISMKENVPQIESIATLGEGNSIGLNDTGFYSLSGVRTATVVALTDLVTLRLNVAAFHGFALTHPHVNEIMHKNAEDMMGQK